MKTARYGVGIYILRRLAQQDLFGVLEKLAELGYDGVELLGLFGHSAQSMRDRLDALSLQALGNHVELGDLLANPGQILSDHIQLGCPHLTISLHNRRPAPGSAGFSEMIGDMRTACQKCLDVGITPLYHNHDWDLAGHPTFAQLVLDECADSGLRFEPDLGWMAFAGADPLEYLARYAGRCPVVHLKDVYATDYALARPGATLGEEKARTERGHFEFRPTGYGTVNFPTLYPLFADANWQVVDHDLSYDRDPFDDLAVSLQYVKALNRIAR